MEIKYKSSDLVGTQFKMKTCTREVSNRFTKCNLDIYQLCNLPNIDVMLEYADEIKDDFCRESVKQFLEQLADQSQKIIWAVAAIEDGLKTCESFTFDTPAREI